MKALPFAAHVRLCSFLTVTRLQSHKVVPQADQTMTCRKSHSASKLRLLFNLMLSLFEPMLPLQEPSASMDQIASDAILPNLWLLSDTNPVLQRAEKKRTLTPLGVITSVRPRGSLRSYKGMVTLLV